MQKQKHIFYCKNLWYTSMLVTMIGCNTDKVWGIRMCRMLGFIMFWIAVGMIIALFLAGNLFLCICIIIILILAGYNMFCH